jgi:energy-coupling factor transporter ATP-binding protein EcfA2
VKTVNLEADVPFVPWSVASKRIVTRQDEHITLVGPTGRGKSTLALELVDRRRYAAIIATKPSDTVLRDALVELRFRTVTSVPPIQVAPRFCIWPEMRGLIDIPQQREVIGTALDTMFRQGGRSVLIDETHYVAEMLRQQHRLKLWWQQGRSINCSLIAGFQRPAWVPRDAYSAASHLFLFGTADDTDSRALGGLGGLSSRTIRYAVEYLAADPERRHHFLYVGTRTGTMLRSCLER